MPNYNVPTAPLPVKPVREATVAPKTGSSPPKVGQIWPRGTKT